MRKKTYRGHGTASQYDGPGIFSNLSEVVGRVKKHVFQHDIVLTLLIEEPSLF
jgi:hypothetical protein